MGQGASKNQRHESIGTDNQTGERDTAVNPTLQAQDLLLHLEATIDKGNGETPVRLSQSQTSSL